VSLNNTLLTHASTTRAGTPLLLSRESTFTILDWNTRCKCWWSLARGWDQLLFCQYWIMNTSKRSERARPINIHGCNRTSNICCDLFSDQTVLHASQLHSCGPGSRSGLSGARARFIWELPRASPAAAPYCGRQLSTSNYLLIRQQQSRHRCRASSIAMHGTEHNRGSCSIVTAYNFSSIPDRERFRATRKIPRRRKRMLARIPGSRLYTEAALVLCGQGEKRLALPWNTRE
jgi:hypothetical protein